MMTDNEALAEALWDAVLTGKFNLDGKETALSAADRISLAMRLIDRIDGPPGQPIEVNYLEKY